MAYLAFRQKIGLIIIKQLKSQLQNPTIHIFGAIEDFIVATYNVLVKLPPPLLQFTVCMHIPRHPLSTRLTPASFRNS